MFGSKNDVETLKPVFDAAMKAGLSLWDTATAYGMGESSLSAKDNEMLVAAINRHWKFINEQVTGAFNGEKTISIDIEK